MKIWYHGTTKKNASDVLKNGFQPGTYFAKHLEDALRFGGNRVFEVMFPESYDCDEWQMIIGDHYPVSNIVSFTVYAINRAIEDTELRQRIFDYNIERKQ